MPRQLDPPFSILLQLFIPLLQRQGERTPMLESWREEAAGREAKKMSQDEDRVGSHGTMPP